MKHCSKDRPIGKCRGCCLNMRTFCAAGLQPRDEWSRGRCGSWNDESLLDRFYHPAAPQGAEAARQARRRKAARTRSTPHYDGLVYVPARSNGPVSRK